MDFHQKIRYRLRPRNLARLALSFLPAGVRKEIIRSLISLPQSSLPGLEFKLATSKQELTEAFTILHDEYVRAGFMEPDKSGMRITPYHALPSTTTLVAKRDGVVVATVSIVRDSAFGFPMEKIFKTEELKRNGVRLAEISSLAIHKDHRQNGGAILFPLLKYLYEYCVKYFGVDVMLIAVNPKHIEFYESLLFFTRLEEQEVENYDFVNGAPAVGAWLNLRDAYVQAAIYYGRKPAKSNLYQFFTKQQWRSFNFPNRKYFKISDPFLTPELLNHFFNEVKEGYSGFSEREKAIVSYLYRGKEYKDALPKFDAEHDFREYRKEVRFDVNCEGRIAMTNDQSVAMKVTDVSLSGFKARLERPIRFGEIHTSNIAVGSFKITSLRGYPVRSEPDGYYGFKLTHSCQNWRDFIQHLEQDLEITKIEVASS